MQPELSSSNTCDNKIPSPESTINRSSHLPHILTALEVSLPITTHPTPTQTDEKPRPTPTSIQPRRPASTDIRISRRLLDPDRRTQAKSIPPFHLRPRKVHQSSKSPAVHLRKQSETTPLPSDLKLAASSPSFNRSSRNHLNTKPLYCKNTLPAISEQKTSY